MEGCAGKQESLDAAVIIVENEAESLPVLEKSDATDQNYLDTCPACHLNFHSREPKLLPCLHSFCKKCLPSPSRNLAMTEPSNYQIDSATKPPNVIRCLVCRQECMEVDVMDNVFVKDSVEAPSSTVERIVQLCMTCDDNTEAAGFCVDCVEYLCVTCVEAHQRVKFTKDHTIRQKTEASQETHRVSTQRPMFCDVHKQEPLKLFCETCDLLTCRDCQLVKHKDHNYQFLEDAYKNHKQHMETLTQQLQDKKKLIEEVSNSINNGLLLVEQNRSSVHDEITKSICSLILEINKKGKLLLNQLESVTKDHESILRKQQEDIGFLSRHLDHVINFTKWATARNGGTALLYCKRLILFQIGNLLRAKCSAAFIPQSTVGFQCRASYWASNVDLGSLVVESVPGHQLGGFQGIPHQLPHPSQGPSGAPRSFALGAPRSTLAQLQMQVDKLNPQAHWQPQPPHPPWTLYQSVCLQRNVPRPVQQYLRGMASSSSYQTKSTDVFSSSPFYTHVTPLPINGGIRSQVAIERTYLNRRDDSADPIYMAKPGYPQGLPPSLPIRNVQGQQNSLVSQEEKPGTNSWKTPETHQATASVVSGAKKRRRSSPRPIIVIKDEPDDDGCYAQTNQRASLPDSTDDQTQISSPFEGNRITTSHSPSRPLSSQWDQSKSKASSETRSVGEEQQVEVDQARLEGANEVLCAVCQTDGDLLCCHKCPRVFHLRCHVPTLLKSPSGEWFCSLCCDLLVPEMEYDCKPEAKTIKKEAEFEGGFSPVDKQKCEKLLLQLFCNKLSSNFQETKSPSVCVNDRLTIKGPVNLSMVKKRLEAKPSLCYQSPAEFVSDIRFILGNSTVLNEVNTEITVTLGKLKEMFEEHLKLIYPDQIFPEIQLEMTPDSQLSPHNNMSQLAKRERTCSDSHDAPSCPSEGEGVA